MPVGSQRTLPLVPSYRCLVSPPIESRPAIISDGSCSVTALRFSRRCSTEDVPGIGRMLGARLNQPCKRHLRGLAWLLRNHRDPKADPAVVRGPCGPPTPRAAKSQPTLVSTTG